MGSCTTDHELWLGLVPHYPALRQRLGKPRSQSLRTTLMLNCYNILPAISMTVASLHIVTGNNDYPWQLGMIRTAKFGHALQSGVLISIAVKCRVLWKEDTMTVICIRASHCLRCAKHVQIRCFQEMGAVVVHSILLRSECNFFRRLLRLRGCFLFLDLGWLSLVLR
jgi:hypothetical protein